MLRGRLGLEELDEQRVAFCNELVEVDVGQLFLYAGDGPGTSASFAIQGSTLVATLVPEPAISGLFGLALAAAFRRRRGALASPA